MQNKLYKYIFISLVIASTLPVKSQVDNKRLRQGVVDISFYIIQHNFNQTSDLEKIDSIYSFAVEYFDKDYSEALLALTFACLPFQEMPLKLPIFDLPLNLQLPTIQNDLFKKRLDKLPSHFLIESPNGKFGDKDKLSHFFGNAFIKYNFAYVQFASFMGAFVELFEGSFKIAGAVDQRDLYINRFGELFGKSLNENLEMLPSRILSLNALNYLIITR